MSRRGRMSRWLGLLAAAVVLGVSVVAVSPGLAHADLCQDAPAPLAPKTGMAGMTTSRPADIPASAPDPFGTDGKVTIGQVYGFQWTWANYDLGCGNDFLRDPVAVTNTQTANVTMGLTAAMIAGLDGLEQMAKDSQLGWLQPVIRAIADSLRGVLMGGDGRVGLFPVALVALAVFLAWKAHRADYASTARAVAIVLVCSGLAAFTLFFPATASRVADGGVQSVASLTGGQFGSSLTDAVSRESAYRTWLTGYFGDADSPLAKELGPRLMSATHYTWSDVARMEADPAARQSIDAAKAAEFKSVAAEVKRRSPTAYETFTGRGERVGPALLGVITTICMSLFAFLAYIMILLGRTMMQALVIAAPVAALVGLLPPGYSALMKMWDLFTAALIAVGKFVLAAGMMTLLLGGISGSDLQGPEKLFWTVLVTIVALILTRPARTLKTIMPGMDPNKSYAADLGGKLATGLLALKGAQHLSAADPTHDPNDEPAADRGQRSSGPRHASLTARGQTESMEPLEPPVWVQVAEPGSQRSTAESGAVSAVSAVPAVSARPVSGASDMNGSPQQRRWQGVLGGSGTVRELPAGSTPARMDERVRVDGAMGSAYDGPPLLAPVASMEDARATTSASGGTGSAGAAGGTSPAGWGEPAVVYPSGVIVGSANDPTLYRSGQARPGEEYVRLPTPDHNDLEDVITYRSQDRTLSDADGSERGTVRKLARAAR